MFVMNMCTFITNLIVNPILFLILLIFKTKDFCFFFRYLILFLNIFYSLILVPISFGSCRCCPRILIAKQSLIKNSLCHIMNPLSYFLTIILFIDSFSKRRKLIDYPYTKYLEGDYMLSLISSIILIMDLLINPRKNHKYSSEIICIISLSIIIYELIYGIRNYLLFYKNIPFYFLENLTLFHYIGYCAISLIICIPCYLFNIFIINYRYKFFPPDEYEYLYIGVEDDDN